MFAANLMLSKQRMDNILTEAAKYTDFWAAQIMEAKNITNTMNKFTVHDQIMQCQCWVPTE